MVWTPRRFDRLAKTLSSQGTRRGMVHLLAGLPLGVTLVSLLGTGPEATAADDDHGSSHRHRRRKTRNARRSGDAKDNHTGKRKGQRKGRKQCRPESPAETCAGKCATVINTCGTPVACGPCTCATGCPQCQTCNPATGLCVPVTNGIACDDGNACTQTDTCQGGVCVGSNPVVCSGCQLSDSCNPSTGACAPDPAKHHTCGGPCPNGEWCHAGACAAIAQTVTVPECGSRCNVGSEGATGVVCGQNVVCPSCGLCAQQTGCGPAPFFAEGPPLGPGNYCATSSVPTTGCSSNADCPSGTYCGHFSDVNLCRTICPF